VANPCPREAAGSVVENPPDLFTRNGVLTVDLSNQTRTDADGRNLFCVNATDVLLPTAGRAEFIVSPPSSNVANASLVTLGINTGPDGDNDPPRTSTRRSPRRLVSGAETAATAPKE